MTNKKLGRVLMIIGAMLIAAALSLNYYNYFHEKQSTERMKTVLSDLKQAIPDSEKSTDSSSPFDIFDDSMTDSETAEPEQSEDITLDGNAYIGIITFPTLGQEFPVTRGWSYAAMNTAACQYSGRRVDNDLIICAHNYTGFFDKLDKLSSGDEVIFIDVYGRSYSYTVTNSELLSGWDSPSLVKGGGSDWDMTLFTCTWSGYSRVTVRLVYSE